VRVLVSGASGLIGTHLLTELRQRGHETFQLVRTTPQNPEHKIGWLPSRKQLDANMLSEKKIDAVINLSGKSIAGLWTKKHLHQVRASRIDSTSLLAETVAAMNPRPKVFISASAIGLYGDRGNERLTEESGSGDGFLASLCRDWEGAADPAREAGIRVVHPRFGVVLSNEGGFLSPLLPLYRFGLGMLLGDGKQIISWVHLEDAIGALVALLESGRARGAVNIVSPNPVTMREFHDTLAGVLRRPALFRVPAAFLRVLVPGGMAEEMMLVSQAVYPEALKKQGYKHRFTECREALENLLL